MASQSNLFGILKGVRSNDDLQSQRAKDTEAGNYQAAGSPAAWDAMFSYFYVLLWITLSATVILFNKYVLAYADFPYPITLTTWHMIFCSIVSAILVQTGAVKAVDGMTFDLYRSAIVPIGVAFALVLWLGNAAYLYLSVSFIQMIKALMPLSVFTVGVFWGTETFTWPTLGNLMVITVGVIIAAYGEINFVLVGVLFQLGSIVVEACRLTLIQVLLQRKSGVKLNSVTTMYYVSPCCAVALLLPWGLLEAPKLYTAIQDMTLVVPKWLLLGNATAAFALNLAVYLLIGKTSALTMNIAGVVKDWLLIGLSAVLYSAPVTKLNLIGYGIAFLAVLWYNNAKMKKAKEAQASQAPLSPSGASRQTEAEMQPLVEKANGR